MKRIILLDCVSDTSSSSSGVSLYYQLEKIVNANENVTIDLKGSDAISSSFFNSSFGDLIDKFGYQKVKDCLKFTNATKTQVKILSYLFKPYKENYSY